MKVEELPKETLIIEYPHNWEDKFKINRFGVEE